MPNTHVSPCAQPTVAVHGAPRTNRPAGTHDVAPSSPTTSHVAVVAQPHCGETPHVEPFGAPGHEDGCEPASFSCPGCPVSAGRVCTSVGRGAVGSGSADEGGAGSGSNRARDSSGELHAIATRGPNASAAKSAEDGRRFVSTTPIS